MCCRDLVAHETTGHWSKMAPFRVLSVDIECQGRKGCFPDAEKDKVIQIASTVQQVGDEAPFLKHVLTLNSCSPIPAAQVESFDREEDMLQRCACCACSRLLHQLACCYLQHSQLVLFCTLHNVPSCVTMPDVVALLHNACACLEVMRHES